jgi:hypothetical protein
MANKYLEKIAALTGGSRKVVEKLIKMDRGGNGFFGSGVSELHSHRILRRAMGSKPHQAQTFVGETVDKLLNGTNIEVKRDALKAAQKAGAKNISEQRALHLNAVATRYNRIQKLKNGK